MRPLFETIVDRCQRAPNVDPDGPFQMQIISLSWSTYVGVIGTGRIKRGRIATNTPGERDRPRRRAPLGTRVLQVLGFLGLERREVKRGLGGRYRRDHRRRESGHLRDPVRPQRIPRRCRCSRSTSRP